MVKVLFIITVLGLCHAYTDHPKRLCHADTDHPDKEEQTDDDVNSALVLEKAQLALTLSAKSSCKDATVVRVTKARHRPEYRWPWSGTRYEINMILRTSKGKEKTCEASFWQTGKDIDNIGETRLCDCSDNTAN